MAWKTSSTSIFQVHFSLIYCKYNRRKAESSIESLLYPTYQDRAPVLCDPLILSYATLLKNTNVSKPEFTVRHQFSGSFSCFFHTLKLTRKCFLGIKAKNVALVRLTGHTWLTFSIDLSWSQLKMFGVLS